MLHDGAILPRHRKFILVITGSSNGIAHIFSAAIIVAHKLENHSQIAVIHIEMLSEQHL